MFEKLFILITVGISWILSFIFIPQGAIGATIIIMMIPALVAFIIIMIKYKSIKKALEPFCYKVTFKSIVFSIIFPLLIIGLCSMLALITETGKLNGHLVNNGIQLLIIVVMSIPFTLITIGEEYGWRGYLLVELEQKVGLKKANIIVSIVWGIFHLPAFFMINLSTGLLNAIIFTCVQVLVVFFINYSYTFLHTLSKNVLLFGLMHSVWNNVNTFVLGDAYRNEATGMIIGDVNLINGERVFGLIFTVISAYLLNKRLKRTIKEK